jgi:hypothetical protein
MRFRGSGIGEIKQSRSVERMLPRLKSLLWGPGADPSRLIASFSVAKLFDDYCWAFGAKQTALFFCNVQTCFVRSYQPEAPQERLESRQW